MPGEPTMPSAEELAKQMAQTKNNKKVEKENKIPNEEKLSSTLQEIKDMELNLSNEDFKKNAHEGNEDRETSTDAFLAIAKKLIDGENPEMNTWGAILSILERDSMKGHPNMELFEKATQEIAEKNNKELKVREGYWEELTETKKK